MDDQVAQTVWTVVMLNVSLLTSLLLSFTSLLLSFGMELVNTVIGLVSPFPPLCPISLSLSSSGSLPHNGLLSSCIIGRSLASSSSSISNGINSTRGNIT